MVGLGLASVYLVTGQCDGHCGDDDQHGTPVPDEVMVDGLQAVCLKHSDQGAVEEVSLHD